MLVWLICYGALWLVFLGLLSGGGLLSPLGLAAVVAIWLAWLRRPPAIRRLWRM